MMTKYFALLLILLSCFACSEEEPIGGGSGTSEDFQIRLILDQSFFLADWPIELLTRADCRQFQSVITDEDGVFTLSDFSPQDLIAFTEVEGQEFGAIITGAQLSTDGVNDINFSGYLLPSIVSVANTPEIDVVKGQATTLSFQVQIDDYPVEKSIVLLQSASTADIQASPDRNGRVSFELTDLDVGVYNFTANLIERGGGFLTFTEITVRVFEPFDLDLQASVTDCNAIELTWNPYSGGDFIGYAITYSFTENNTSCGESNGITYISEARTTTASIQDYGLTDDVCFTISLETNNGAFNSDAITVDQPYENIIVGEYSQISHVAPNGQFGIVSFDFNTQQNLLCIGDQSAGMLTCSNNSIAELTSIFSTEDGFYATANNGNFLFLYDQNLNEIASVVTGTLSDKMLATDNGFLIIQSIDNPTAVRLVDLSTGTIGEPITVINNDFLGFIAAEESNVFGVIESNFLDRVETITYYSISDQNNLIELNTIELANRGDLPLIRVSSDGKTIGWYDGRISIIGSGGAQIFQPFNSTVFFSDVYVGSAYAAFIDDAAGEIAIVDLDTRSVTGFVPFCVTEQIIGIVDGTLVSVKSVNGRMALSYTPL